MKYITAIICIILLSGCQPANTTQQDDKQQIVETLQRETRYFCQRDLDNWQKQWAHRPFAAKMYATDTSFQAWTGWEAINQFTVQHLRDYPDTIPIPEVRVNYDIHLLGQTAWVFFAKTMDGLQVAESRFMVREDGTWKIARMQTVY